ncbi:hypothetical protein ABZY16_18590 [Streptomyces sp. NPDC006553]|uniref:hypothetical protein n=1 Tax=unclassified Streptomyces TaxID=2593676 RepID=UPI002259EDD9|nr:hypothetical protein [Streptomyces sp. NBC_00233]MCX5226439.1 hypothetical protein [Streptomyces sp. NBC_00233]
MLHISLALIVGIGFAGFVSVVAAAAAFALSRGEGETMFASVRWGAGAFAGALTLGILILTLLRSVAG